MSPSSGFAEEVDLSLLSSDAALGTMINLVDLNWQVLCK